MSLAIRKGIKLYSGIKILMQTIPLVTDGLILHLDARNPASYPGSGTTWFDLSGVGNNFTLDAVGLTYNSGVFDLTELS